MTPNCNMAVTVLKLLQRLASAMFRGSLSFGNSVQLLPAAFLCVLSPMCSPRPKRTLLSLCLSWCWPDAEVQAGRLAYTEFPDCALLHPWQLWALVLKALVQLARPYSVLPPCWFPGHLSSCAPGFPCLGLSSTCFSC